MQELQEFFQFSRDLFDWRFLSILMLVSALGLSLPDKWTKPFRSVKANIWLFTAIAVASAIGTFLPQNKPPEEAVAKFGSFWAGVFDTLGFFDIYHTWWFALLLAVMAFNVIVCKLRRLPLKVFGPPRKERGRFNGSVASFLSKATHKEEWVSKEKLEACRSQIAKTLKEKGLTIQEAPAHVSVGAKGKSASKKKDGWVFYAGRHYVQRWGDFILHVSIVVVLAGNLVGALLGFEEAVPVMEGASAQMTHLPYDIYLKDFEIDYYSSTGAPSLYASQIEVKKKDKLLGKKRIVVNDPLDIEGVRFYQASWGMTDQFRSARLYILGQFLTIRPGEIAKIPGLPYSIRANSLLPTFDIDEHGHVVSRDFEGKNPALQIDFLEKENVIGRIWALKDHPEMAFRIVGDKVERTMTPPFRIANLDPVLFSGIQVGYDPGAAVFWVGSLVLLFGLCLHFYCHQRRVRILIVADKSKSTIYMGGWNSRLPQDFQSEFLTLTESLKRRLEA